MSTKLDAVLFLYSKLSATVNLPPMPARKRDLLFWMEEPEAQVLSTDDVVVLKDKYPKSEMHFLVLPKEDINTIRDVKYEHLNILKEMDRIGRLIASEKGGNRKFWFGYLALQTQRRLHLHVISNDLCGTGMTTTWHWNSFTTPFFMKSEDVIDSLTRKRILKVPTRRQCKEWLKGPMFCHFCSSFPSDVYLMKDHVREHFMVTDISYFIKKKKKKKIIPTVEEN